MDCLSDITSGDCPARLGVDGDGTWTVSDHYLGSKGTHMRLRHMLLRIAAGSLAAYACLVGSGGVHAGGGPGTTSTL